MFANTSVNEIFPTPIWIGDLTSDTYGPMNEKMRVALDEMLSPRPPIQVGGTWQTEQNLHELEPFGELTECIITAASGAFKFLEIEYENFVITGCWANINPPGAINTSQTHPNNYLSGVYFIQVSPGANKIAFSDPRPQAGAILPKLKNFNRFNGNEITVDTKEGRLLIFPAWLHHAVPVNRSNRERTSVSFNLMFRDYTETMSQPLWKGIPISSRTGN